jgi:non-heme chloroperoxidase
MSWSRSPKAAPNAARTLLIHEPSNSLSRGPESACQILRSDGFRAALAANRAQFYLDIPSGPFYGFNRPGAKVSQGLIDSWWRQGMMGGAKAQYDCIKAFSETDFTEDLKAIQVPTLILHGDDDQVVPFADSGPLSAKLVKHSTFKVYPGGPHGVCQAEPEMVNRDLLAFVKGESLAATPSGRKAA